MELFRKNNSKNINTLQKPCNNGLENNPNRLKNGSKVGFMVGLTVLTGLLLGACASGQTLDAKATQSLQATQVKTPTTEVLASATDPVFEVTPFSIDAYCDGEQVLKDFYGHEHIMPTSCGNYRITAKSIDEAEPGATYAGRAWMTDTTDPSGDHLSGDFDEILINRNIPACLHDAIVRKEGSLNAAVAAFLEKIGLLNYFVAQDPQTGQVFMADGGHLIVDTMGIKQSLRDADAATLQCFREAGIDVSELMPMGTKTLSDLSADGQINRADFCAILNETLAASGYANPNAVAYGTDDVLAVREAICTSN